jgi:hypothetical protein
LVVLLSSCNVNHEENLIYDESNFVFEVNETVDVRAYLRWKNTILIDESEIDFSVVGEYVLYVTDTDTNKVYEIPVIIEDTQSPEIIVAEDFDKYYEIGSEINFNEITVIDNSLEDITFSSNIEDIDMNKIGEYSLVITAQDSTGNLTVKSLPINVRTVIYPIINLNVFDVSDTSFKVQFLEDDPNGYRVSARYSVTQDGTLVAEGNVTKNSLIDITDLYQSTVYRVVFYYTFLIPGETQKVMSKSTFITTIDLFEPIVELEDVLITLDSLSFSVGVIDPDQLLGDIQVSVANENGDIVLQRLLADLPDFELDQLNLQEQYTVTIRYSYDLADGNGVQEYVNEYTYQIVE